MSRRTLRKLCSTVVGIMLASSAIAGSSFSGYVTDVTGVEPIAGAVVSVEWRLVANGKASPGRPVPTYLAAWQARTNRDGSFHVSAPPEPLVLPAGTALAPGQTPRVRVFALGHEAVDPLRQRFVHSMGSDRRIKIVTWPAPNQMIRLERVGDTEMLRQLDAWYAEVQRAAGYDVWPGGEAQARGSYRPLLELIAEACAVLEYRANLRPTTCTRARAEFNLRTFEPQWVEVTPTASKPLVESPPERPVIVTGTPAPIAGRKQEPPSP